MPRDKSVRDYMRFHCWGEKTQIRVVKWGFVF